jgi:putative CocE/NonD family hydrolase
VAFDRYGIFSLLERVVQKRRILIVSLLTAGIVGFFAAKGRSASQPKLSAGFPELNVRVPMSDGVRLSTNIFHPAGSGRFPTILIRTPYNKGTTLVPNYQAFVDHGYVVVMQDVRGRYGSEGTFSPLSHEAKDGDETLNWIAAQVWSDGKVGMTGGSYLGIAQWKVALLNNPHLKAIFPVVSGWDDYRDRFYSTGGAMKLGHRLLWMSENLRRPDFVPDFKRFIWTLPVRRGDEAATGKQLAVYQESIDHPSDDEFWKALSTKEHIKDIRIPVFTVGGWYDNYAESDLEAFEALHKHNGTNRVLIGPWPHNMSIPFKYANFGPQSSLPIRRFQLEWFDHWLKGLDTPMTTEPPVQIFVMGSNVWRHENEWPIARTRHVRFYMASGGHANSFYGDGTLALAPQTRSVPDQYTYDPLKPVPTMGGAVCCNPTVFPWGPMDQRAVEKRRDVLVYTSTPLKRDLEVTGAVEVVLRASSSASDTDFTAKLVDVFPGGETRNLTDGILRARYRESLEKPQLMKPGEVYLLTIDAGVTSNVFLKGHRIRVEISSSNFPRFDRNLNTGKVVEDEVHLRTARQVIYHDRNYSSYIQLPVIPKS